MNIFAKIIPQVEKGNFLGCIIIYLICDIISLIMNKLFRNIKLIYLFL